MNNAEKQKDELLKQLLVMSQHVRKGDVSPSITGQFNLILVHVYEQLGLDLRGLGITLGDHKIVPPGIRHADDPTPLTVTELEKCFASGEMFRDRLQDAIVRLDAFLPPKDRPGFV